MVFSMVVYIKPTVGWKTYDAKLYQVSHMKSLVLINTKLFTKHAFTLKGYIFLDCPLELAYILSVDGVV